MRSRISLISVFALGVVGFVGCETQGKKTDSVKPESHRQKVGYSIGLDIGKNFQAQMMDVDLDMLMAGIHDVIDSQEHRMSEEEVRTTMMEFQQEMMAKFQEKQKQSSGKNTGDGKKFLEENAKKEGVKVTPSGLQYEVLKSGEGPSPKSGQQVSCHYVGTLIDGSEFDNSISRGEPLTIGVDDVIPGWSEALKMMKKGDKWKLVIPSEIGYGERGAGEKIGPNATLIFEVELLNII